MVMEVGTLEDDWVLRIEPSWMGLVPLKRYCQKVPWLLLP